MQKVAVITCFSYLGNKKYVFNPEYLRSDLRRIVSFSHNKVGCPLDRIYVLTDLRPSELIRKEILDNFQAAVKAELRLPRADLNEALRLSQKHEARPLDWLRSLSGIIEPQRPDHLYRRLLRQILPVIRNSSVVEFASLFSNLIIISGEGQYRTTLETIFRLPMTHLVFYYTGHGIGSRTGSYLLIPRSGQVDLQSREIIQNLFKRILNNVHALIVFDCCHAEGLIELPYKMTFTWGSIRSDPDPGRAESKKEVIYLSSTLSDQTCGFYTLGSEYGSLYTYYLIKFLTSVSKTAPLCQLRSEVEERVRQYRKRQMKPPQNMLIGLSHRRIEELPRWLFERSEPGFDLIEAQ